MKKTLIISQKQLDEITNGTPYLDTDNPCRLNAGSNEITTGGKISIGKEGLGGADARSATGDEIERSLGHATNYWYGAGKTAKGAVPVSCGGFMESYTKKDFEAKLLSEMNQALNGVTINVIQPNPQDPYNPITYQTTEEDAAKRKTIAKQNGNIEEFKALDKALKVPREMVKAQKKTKTEAGMTNQYQKAGGSKDVGNGKAHTSKMQKVDGSNIYISK